MKGSMPTAADVFSKVKNQEVITLSIVTQILEAIKDFQKYEEIKLIGQGHFSLIFSGYNIKKFRREAIKFISFEAKKKPELEELRKKAQAIRENQSKAIIEIFEEQFIEKSGECFLVITMELCERSLEDLIEEMKREKKQFNAGKLEYMVIALFDGLNCFHQGTFLHQNIKLSNILLKENQFKYTDFALPHLLNPFRKSQFGTAMFIAPEVTKKEPYTSKSDLYCLGFVLMKIDNFDLLNYEQFSDDEDNKKVMKWHYQMFQSKSWPEEEYPIKRDSMLFPIIKDLIQVNPNARRSAKYHIEKLILGLKNSFKPIPILFSYTPDYEQVLNANILDDGLHPSSTKKLVLQLDPPDYSENRIFKFINYRNDEIELINIAKHFFFKKHCYTHFSLECSNREVNDKVFLTLCESFKHQNRLQSISLTINFNNSISDAGLNGLVEQLANHQTTLSQLHLNFNYNHQFSSNAIGNLFECFSNLYNLSSLYLNLNGTTDFSLSSFQTLCRNLKNITSLVSLALIFQAHKKLRDDSLENLAAALSNLMLLQSLDIQLQRCYLASDAGMVGLLEAIQSLHSLHTLHLDFNCNEKFTDEVLRRLIQATCSLPNLNDLVFNFQNCNLFSSALKRELISLSQDLPIANCSIYLKEKQFCDIEEYKRELDKSEIFELGQKFV